MISTLQHFNLSCLDNELYVISSIRVFYIHLRHIRPDRKTQIVNCRQNKTHSRKQVLKYVNLVKSRSFRGLCPPGPPTRALPWTHWGPWAAPWPLAEIMRILRFALATPLVTVTRQVPTMP